jgi:hypothetical protein
MATRAGVVVSCDVTGLGGVVVEAAGQQPSSIAAPANAPITFKKLRRVTVPQRLLREPD